MNEKKVNEKERISLELLPRIREVPESKLRTMVYLRYSRMVPGQYQVTTTK
jgi:hypothetical protein